VTNCGQINLGRGGRPFGPKNVDEYPFPYNVHLIRDVSASCAEILRNDEVCRRNG